MLGESWSSGVSGLSEIPPHSSYSSSSSAADRPSSDISSSDSSVNSDSLSSTESGALQRKIVN